MFDRKRIETFGQGGQVLRQAVAGLSREQLTAFPVPGTWSIQQIVVHLMDSDAVAVDRMKRIAAMNNPLLMGYDETAYIEKLSPHEMPIEACLDLFDLNRRLMADILRRLPDDAFARTGVHNERGKVRLGELVEDYIDHLEHHLRFISQKRQMLDS